MKAVLAFAAGSFLTFALASGISRATGGAASVQILLVLSAAASVFLLIGFGIGAAIRRRLPQPLRSAGLGAAGAAAFVALLVAAAAAGANPAESWMLLLALPLLGGLSTLLTGKASP